MSSRHLSLLAIALLAGCAATNEEAEASRDESEATASRPFVVGGWNLEYFGSTTEGPVDDERQLANAQTVIERLAPDVIGLEEITNDARFGDLRARLSDYDGFTAASPRVEGGPEGYANIRLRLAILFRRSRVTFLGAKLVPGIDVGRPPLEATFSVDGRTQLTLIVVHFYPFAELGSWHRRRTSADRLREYLDVHHADGRVAVVGDWNDDVDESIVEGLPTPFAQLRDDGRYTFTTQGLSVARQGTTTSYPSTIDHHLVTNELAAHFVARSAWVERPGYIADYRATTSDHYPVVTRYTLP